MFSKNFKENMLAKTTTPAPKSPLPINCGPTRTTNTSPWLPLLTSSGPARYTTTPPRSPLPTSCEPTGQQSLPLGHIFPPGVVHQDSKTPSRSSHPTAMGQELTLEVSHSQSLYPSLLWKGCLTCIEICGCD